MAEEQEVSTTSADEVDERRQIELEILEAAKDLRSFELGSVRRGLGRLSVGRVGGQADRNIRTIIAGTERLQSYDQTNQKAD